MLVDIKRITRPNSRNQIFIGLDPKFLDETVFEPGSHVNVIYEKDKIIITKDIEDYIVNNQKNTIGSEKI